MENLHKGGKVFQMNNCPGFFFVYVHSLGGKVRLRLLGCVGVGVQCGLLGPWVK